MAKTLIFAIERLGAILDDVLPVARVHWEETEEYRQKFRRIRSMDERLKDDREGRLAFATARTEQGELVGYGSFRIYSPRSDGALIAVHDVLFLLPAYRQGFNSAHLFKTAEKEVLRRGIRKICLDVPTKLAALWESHKYEEVTRKYVRLFSEEDANEILR